MELKYKLMKMRLAAKAVEIQTFNKILFCAFFAVSIVFSASCGGGGEASLPPPHSPRLVASLPISCGEDVEIDGNYLYVADGFGGVKAVDITMPSAPTIKARIPTTYAYRAHVKDGYLYLCDGPAGVKVFSLGTPSTPSLVDSYNTEWACDIAFAHGYMYLADYWGGVSIFHDEGAGHIKFITKKAAGRFRGIAVDGGTLALADSPYGLVLFRLATPENPIYIFSNASEDGNFKELIMIGDYVILSRSDQSPQIEVFHTGGLVSSVSTISPARFIEGMTLSGDLLLAACGEEGVKAFDVKNPAKMKGVWAIPTKGYARRAKIQGRYLYVASITSLEIYDVGGLEGVAE